MTENEETVTIALVCIVRGEQPYIKEWVNYHFSIGFTDIYIYDNDIVTGTYTEIFKDHPCNVNVIPYHFGDQKVQYQAYHDWLVTFREKHTWVMFSDADEFLVLHRHRTVRLLCEEHIQSGALIVYWVMFGNDGHDISLPNIPVTHRFRSSVSISNNHTKSIAKCSDIRTMGIHTPGSLAVGTIHNTMGEVLDGPLTHSGPIDVCQVNHYYTKSTEEYHIKCLRGRADITEMREFNPVEPQTLSTVKTTSILYGQPAFSDDIRDMMTLIGGYHKKNKDKRDGGGDLNLQLCEMYNKMCAIGNARCLELAPSRVSEYFATWTPKAICAAMNGNRMTYAAMAYPPPVDDADVVTEQIRDQFKCSTGGNNAHIVYTYEFTPPSIPLQLFNHKSFGLFNILIALDYSALHLLSNPSIRECTDCQFVLVCKAPSPELVLMGVLTYHGVNVLRQFIFTPEDGDCVMVLIVEKTTTVIERRRGEEGKGGGDQLNEEEEEEGQWVRKMRHKPISQT
jgi:Glycosyl transferase family 2